MKREQLSLGRTENSQPRNRRWNPVWRARPILNRFDCTLFSDEGGGAFYGPKIDLNIQDALNRDWQCTTVQFDFNLPERFDLVFQNDNGERAQPYMIHRAILGSIERFIGILIEHYSGAFPVWLAPVQAMIIPISDRHLEYADSIQSALSSHGIRIEVDSRRDRMNAKIRDAQMQKIPYMVVVGDSEAESQSVSVRLRDGTNLGAIPIPEFQELVSLAVTNKTI